MNVLSKISNNHSLLSASKISDVRMYMYQDLYHYLIEIYFFDEFWRECYVHEVGSLGIIHILTHFLFFPNPRVVTV